MRKPDIPADKEMDAILDLLLATTGAAMGTITFVDEHRQWFKARRNVPFEQTSRDVAFCAHGILGGDLFVVEDARNDPRSFNNSLVTGKTGVVFFAIVETLSRRLHALDSCACENQVFNATYRFRIVA